MLDNRKQIVKLFLEITQRSFFREGGTQIIFSLLFLKN